MNFISRLTNWYFSSKSLPYWCILVIDSLIVLFSGYCSAYLQFGGNVLASSFWQFTLFLLFLLFVFICFFRVFHTYSGIIRFSSFLDLYRVGSSNLLACVVSNILFILFSVIDKNAITLSSDLYFIPFFLLLFILTTTLMWIVRVLVKSLYEYYNFDRPSQKTFIYGVRAGAVSIANSIMNSEQKKYTVGGFICPVGESAPKYLMGIRVYEDEPGVLEHMRKVGAKSLVVSPLLVDSFREQVNLINDFTNAGIRIYVMPKALEWDGKSQLIPQLFHRVEIEDLLPRDPIQINMNTIADQLHDKTILVTGAAGSIGSEIVHQISTFSPRRLVLVDQAETPMHDLRVWADGVPGLKTETIVASITNQPFMEQLFAQYRPEYVFHAAAYKHVPMMEDNPAIAIQNNIRGTHVIADLAVKYGTRKFVMVSTDKAVNPTNVMGCSKRICEIYCQSLNQAIVEGNLKLETVDGLKPETHFVTTRFGNVLGSNGSVIPLFRKQIKHGGPITVTHPDIIRFFMLIPEACKLVLEAATLGKGGEIFVFDMGKPVRIVDLAKRMIALSGAKNIEIKFTGLREGEKLYEEVLSDKETVKSTPNSKIFVATVREYDYSRVAELEERLYQASFEESPLALVRMMQVFVPEYISTNPSYSNN